MIYVNKIELGITFKTKTRSYIGILATETMKLLGSTQSRITKNENSENMPYLEITEVVLMHCNILNKDYQHDSRFLYTLVPNKSNTRYFTQELYIFRNF